MFSITIKPDITLSRKLGYLDDDLRKEILAVLKTQAASVAAAARRKLKSAGHVNTGKLVKSIRAKRASKRRQLSYSVTAEFYGRYLEFGTKDRKTRRGRRNRGSLKPMPFFLPSDQDRERFGAEISDAVEKALRIFATR